MQQQALQPLGLVLLVLLVQMLQLELPAQRLLLWLAPQLEPLLLELPLPFLPEFPRQPVLQIPLTLQQLVPLEGGPLQQLVPPQKEPLQQLAQVPEGPPQQQVLGLLLQVLVSQLLPLAFGDDAAWFLAWLLQLYSTHG